MLFNFNVSEVDKSKVIIYQISFFALPLSLILAYILNGIFKHSQIRTHIFKQVIKDDELENLLLRSAGVMPLLLTMNDNKVYVGYINESVYPTRTKRNYLKILPLLSGYRDQKRMVRFTTRYKQFYTEGENFHEDNLRNFEVVLPIAEIRSASLFNSEIYEEFQKQQADAS